MDYIDYLDEDVVCFYIGRNSHFENIYIRNK